MLTPDLMKRTEILLLAHGKRKAFDELRKIG